MKRIILGALGLLAALAWSGPSLAQGNSCAGGAIPGMVVGGTTASGACYYIKVNSDGSINANATVTPGGTQDVNLTKVNGAAVNVGTGAASTGTQRVTTSTDSTVGTVTTLSTITNPVGVKGADGAAIASITNALPTIGVYKNVSVIPTVQNAAYTAGQSLGGLQTLTVLSNGLVQQVQLASKGGSVIGTWVYIWNKSPANSTCTDKSNFVVSQTDNQNLVVQPFLLTPALGVSANDASTYASQTNIAAPFVNNDTSPGSSLYVCLLAAATVTPATTTDLRLNLQAAQ